jgi:CRP-like cAMP-binding protein
MKEKLNHYIQELISLTENERLKIIEGFEVYQEPKNHLLIKESKVTKYTHFLESGFVRSYTLNTEGEEITTNIFSAPCFVNEFISFFKQQPAVENYQTLTSCVILKMNYETVQKYFHNYPEFREFGRMMLVTNYSNLHERMLSMIKDTAERRYLTLIKQHPDVFQNVPLKIIASYLGVTDTSLSRIRNKIAQK